MLLALVATFAAVGCDDAADEGSVAARVGNTTISTETLDQEVAAARRIKAQYPKLTVDLSRRALLGRLITDIWYLREAQARGFTLPQRPLNVNDRRTLVFSTLVEAIDREQKPRITEREKRAYYVEHRSEYTVPAQSFTQIAEAPTRRAALQGRQALRAGKAWQDVRARFGQNTAAVTGERNGFLPISRGQRQVPRALETAAFHVPVDTVSGPIRVGSTWYNIRVLERRPATTQSLERVSLNVEAAVRRRKTEARVKGFLARVAAKYRKKTTCLTDVRPPECGKSSQGT